LIKTVSGAYGGVYQYGQNGLLLEETNASGVAQADYIYLGGRPVAVLNGSTLYYLHTDRLGTPQLATDSNRAVAWLASYDSFGQASVSGMITQNLRFPGQYFDVESGWNHNGFRDYAPTLGRYIEPDPLGRLGSGNNLYVYVDDNPVNLSDPLGLCVGMISALKKCVSSRFPNVTLVDFLPTVVNGEGAADNMNGVASVEIDYSNGVVFGEITNAITPQPSIDNNKVSTPYTSQETGFDGGYTSSGNHGRTILAAIQLLLAQSPLRFLNWETHSHS
jgi:RHS repeat-associated protein